MGVILENIRQHRLGKSIHTTLRFNIKKKKTVTFSEASCWIFNLNILASLWHLFHEISFDSSTHPGLATNHRSHERALLGALMTFRKTKKTDFGSKKYHFDIIPHEFNPFKTPWFLFFLYFLVDPLDGQHTTQAVELSGLASLLLDLKSWFFFSTATGFQPSTVRR